MARARVLRKVFPADSKDSAVLKMLVYLRDAGKQLATKDIGCEPQGNLFSSETDYLVSALVY